jgi:adenosylcobinamide-phosphate synthase
MSFLALLLAFLVEQLRPLPRANPVHEGLRRLADWTTHNIDASSRLHAMLAWALVVLLPTFAVWAIAVLLGALHPIFELIFHVAVLWFTLGFRQFSHHFTEMQFALARGDTGLARQHLQAWLRARDPSWSADPLTVPELCRVAIEEGVVDSHRHVFGVLFWYTVLPGPCGAVLYRFAVLLREHWEARVDGFGIISRQAFHLLDWVPARLTAIGFAVVGNFEDALYGWRQRASAWPDRQRGVVVEAAAGALGVQLSPRVLNAAPAGAMPVPGSPVDPVGMPHSAAAASDIGVQADGILPEPERNLPQPATLHAAVGLLWRAVVLWMVLLLMISLVYWVS